jgi:aspartyl-tRNA(Asn)/glutamyl-tRNA(Gln) amidotransferase subunit A
MNITDLTLVETLEALKKGDFIEEELNLAYQTRISDVNPKLNAFLQVSGGKTGIPAGIKSLISTKDLPTSSASKIIEQYIPPFNATVVDKLLTHNIRILGKTNQDEFAMGSSGENSAFGVTKNPWDLTKVPGGSSSGSAAAVAADLCVFALGTDTGGSIRQPASLCGVVGLKPSYGRVSRYGAIAMASSLDQIGPITKSVGDARLVLEWISGGDSHDSNAVVEPFKSGNVILGSGATPESTIDSGQARMTNLKNVKVGVPNEYFGKGLDPKVELVIKTAIKKMEELGAEIVAVSLPHTEYAVAAYYIIMFSEVSSNLARFDGIRFGGTREHFGEEVKRRIMLGTFSLSSGYYDAYFQKAAKVRTLVKKDFDDAFKKCDVIIGPVSPTVAWNIGEKVDDPLAMYLSDIYTIPASLAGIPGLSVPGGFSEGLPVGLQILGKYMDEETILNVGEIYEKATGWMKEKPKL